MKISIKILIIIYTVVYDNEETIAAKKIFSIFIYFIPVQRSTRLRDVIAYLQEKLRLLSQSSQMDVVADL